MLSISVVRAYTFKPFRSTEEILDYLVAYANKPVETMRYRLKDEMLSFEYSFPSTSRYKAGMTNIQASVRGIIDLRRGVVLLTRIDQEDVVEPLLDLLSYALGSRPRPAKRGLGVTSKYECREGECVVRGWIMILFNKDLDLLEVRIKDECPGVSGWADLAK